MTAEPAHPKFSDAFGPDLTPELAEWVWQQVNSGLGIQLAADDLLLLHRAARDAAHHRTMDAPTTGESKSSIAELAKTAKALRDAIALVQKLAAEPIVIGRANFTHDFMEDTYTVVVDDDEEEWKVLLDPTEDLLRRLVADVETVRHRAKHALGMVRPAGRGKGKQIVGYPDYILACRSIWSRHRTDKGWSKKEGRGCGPFVSFVYLTQDLLPRGMRKGTLEKVGDAISAALEGTT
jgi:hypothetical protein